MKEELDEKLEQLCLSKSFEELTNEERAYVLSLTSEDDYTLFSDFLNDVVDASQQKIKNTEVRADLKKNLSKAFRKKHQKNRSKIGTLSLVVTLAASLLLIFTVYKSNDSTIHQKETVKKFKNENRAISIEEFVQSTQVDKTIALMQDDEVTKELMTMDFSKFKGFKK